MSSSGCRQGQGGQRVVRHHEDYELTPANVEGAYGGEDWFIKGNTLAASESVCTVAGANEVMYYFTADQDRPEVVTGLIIPEQTTSAASCSARGEELIAVGRRAREQGRVVVGAGHSHGLGLSFSSQLDWALMDRFLVESVCLSESARLSTKGVVREVTD